MPLYPADILPLDADDLAQELDAAVADDVAVVREQRATERALSASLELAVAPELAQRAADKGNYPLAARLKTQAEGRPLTPEEILKNYRAAFARFQI